MSPKEATAHMMARRRQATREELRRGEEEMRAAQRRMEAEGAASGELPIEDRREVEPGAEVLGVVSAPPIEDSVVENSERTAVVAQGEPVPESPAPAITVAATSPIQPPTRALPSPVPEGVQENATPQAGEVPRPIEETPRPTGIPRSFHPNGEMTPAAGVTPPQTGQVTPMQTPLFTNDQLRTFAAIQQQATWLYPPAFSSFAERPAFLQHPIGATPNVERPSSLDVDQARAIERQWEDMQQKYSQEVAEKFELKKVIEQVCQQNQVLQDKVLAMEARMKDQERKPDSPGSSGFQSYEREVQGPPPQAAPPEEAAQAPVGGVTQEAEATQQEAADPQSGRPIGSSLPEERPRDHSQAQQDGSGSTTRPQAPLPDPTPPRDGGPNVKKVEEENFAVKSMEVMALMLTSMQKIQDKMTEGREDHGSVQGVEVVRSGIPDLPPLPQWSPLQGPLQLGDWLLMVEPLVADLSTTSHEWWMTMNKETEKWYHVHMTMGPLERLQHDAVTPESMKEVRWQRLERRVSAMVLQAVPESVREELVASRRLTVFGMLTHLLQTYCPGGVMERQTLLRNLEEPAEVHVVGDAPTALRRWMRWKRRTLEIGATPPDPSILLKGLNRLMKRVLESNRDLQFRVALVRTSLMVDTTPTDSNIDQLARHMLAEVEQLALVDKKTSPAPKPEGPKIKNMDGEKDKPRPKERTSEGEGKPKCKFYLSDSGCRKGRECSFSHEVRDEKGRCYVCGSTDHMASSCQRPKTPKDGTPKAKSAKAEKEEGSPSAEKTKKGEESQEQGDSVKDLLQEANRMLRSLSGGGSSAESSTSSKDEEDKKDLMEKLHEQLKGMKLKPFRINRLKSSGTMGLLDSGATHALRSRRPDEDVSWYPEVQVELASGQHIRLRMSLGGAMISEEGEVEPIVPLGFLVNKLNYEVSWKHGLMSLWHPRHGEIPIRMKDSCPHVSKRTALDMIAEIEDYGRDVKIKAVDYGKENEWLIKLIDTHPALKNLPLEIKKKLVVEVGDWSDLPGNRRARRKWKREGLHVHLYAGPDEGFTLTEAWKQKGGNPASLLEVDILRGLDHDMLTDKGVFGGLLRCAFEGKIHSIAAGPNCRSRSVLRNYPTGKPNCPRPVRRWGGEEFGIKEATSQEKDMLLEDDVLLFRAIVLFLVCTYVRRAKGISDPTRFLMERPSSPKAYAPQTVSWWDTEEWKLLQKEFDLQETHFNQGDLGASVQKPTTFGGNVELDVGVKTRIKMAGGPITDSKQLSRWAPGLMTLVAQALLEGRTKDEVITVKKLTWEEHFSNGHIPFRKDCYICQRTHQQQMPHRKVQHPHAGVLALDTAGPLIPAKDLGGLPVRYALIGALSWAVPLGLTKIQDSHDEEPLEEGAPDIEEKKDGSDAPKASDQPAATHLQQDQEREEGEDGSDAPKASDEPAATHLRQEEEEDVEAEELPEILKDSPQDGTEDFVIKTFRLAIPLKSKKAKHVTEAATEMLLRLRADGYHIGHVHCDQGHEFSGAFKTWCRNRALRLTRTPGDSPQSNGRAEVAVKAIKTQVRRVLFQAGQGNDKWPWAMRYVNELNRAMRIGQPPDWPPFYSEVLVRKRTWKRGSFEPTVEVVNYLTPTPEEHGHYVQPPGERPRLTRCLIRKAENPPDERKWLPRRLVRQQIYYTLPN